MSLFEPFYTLYRALSDPELAPLFLLGLGQIALMWGVYAVLFIGLGGWVGRGMWGFRIHRTDDLLRAFWLGWAVNLGMLQVWHLFAPIHAATFGLLALVGGVGLLVVARDVWRVLWASRGAWPYLLTFGGLGVLFANAAMGAPSVGDFALYHQQAIIWNKTYPIVNGLGNLHGRLAFNNATFLYAAQLDSAPLAGIGNHTASGLLIMAGLAWGLIGWRRVMRGDVRPSALLTALTLPVVFWTTANNEHIRTPDNDLPPLILGLVVSIVLLQLFEQDDRPRQKQDLALLIVLAAAGLIGKLSFAVFGGMAAGVALVWLARVDWRDLLRPVLIAGGVALVLVGVWMWRGVILSGYPLYPATVAAFDVDWRMSCEVAQTEADWVYAWARQPFTPIEELTATNWLFDWLVRTLRRDMEVVTPLLVLAISAVWRVRLQQRLSATWAYVLVPLAALVFWFFAAPDPRFAGSAIWLLAYGVAALTLADYGRAHPQVVQAVALMLVILLSYETRETFLTYLPENGSAFHAQTEAAVVPFTTDSGLTVFVPDTTQRADEDRCYHAALPCTPFRNPDLQLRNPDDMSAGFRVESALTCAELP